ncbi:MAG: AAA family ATPase, partial [Acidobacteriota bacterium]
LDLRKVLGDDPATPRFIQTLPKRGYCFVAQVTDAKTPDAAAMATSPNTPANANGLAGREQELTRLTTIAQALACGQRQTVFLSGVTGIGKTALVDAACHQMVAMLSATVACGQCIEGLSSKQDYYAVMEILRQLCASAVGEMTIRVLANTAPAWLAALGREPDSTHIESRSTSPKTPADLCRALEEVANDRALVLVFEDLQWANEFTLEFISALARRRTPTRLMVVATCSSHCGVGEHALKALKQDLVLHRQCTELELAPLSKMAIRQLLIRELGQEELPTGLDTLVYQYSEGRPLFALAFLKHLIAERYIALEDENHSRRWERRAAFPDMDTSVPHELAQLIDPEIERLCLEDQRVLEAASLMKVVFPAWAVAAALEQDLAATEEACDRLARRSCFVHRAGYDELPDGTRSDFYAFAHGLYREVLYQKQTASRRAKGHTRIAERLGELFAGREDKVAREMAMHYESAGNWKRAMTTLRAAAQHAHQRQEYSEAAQLLQHSLAMAENLSDSERLVMEQEIHSEMELARVAMEGSKHPHNPSEEIDGFWMGT